MGDNLERHRGKIVEMPKEAMETPVQITTMVVAKRIDKSGRMHPWRRATLDYLVEQSEEQVTYYTQYW